MRWSIVALVIGLLLGLGVGAVGGHVVWSTPCPACPEPTPCPAPEVKMVEVVCPTPRPEPDEGPEAEDETAPSAFYRGWLGSCISNGQLAGAPMETTVKYCGAHLRYGIDGDWFDLFRPDNWAWPPPTPAPKSDAGP